LRDFDSTRQLARIQIPALVIAGDDDVSTPWQGHGEILARQIPGAQAVQLPAAHLSNLERPRSFNAAIFGFLLPKDEGGAPERGNRIRRAVLGDAHVNDAEASITDFNRDFQHFIAGNVWGNVWARAGLDLRTRRLVALVILASLGRWEEFSMHVRAGNERELEACDLKEALLQVAVYAGVPAANTAFRLAGDILSGKSGKES
jgi:3-oxoadipate enol-lactonase/4-carboxymuconolactone decarboxylase